MMISALQRIANRALR